MAINAVSSPTSTSARTVEHAKPPAPPKAEAPKPAKEANPAPQAQKSAPPKPVVNTQGQKTGQVVNVTA